MRRISLEPIKTQHLLVAACLVVIAAVCQYMFGRVWWCECGLLNPWSGEIASQHNSQHLFDPYTFTHILHGVMFYFLLWLTLRRWFGIAERFVIAIGIEAVWEVIENTSIVIERYRETTISLGYYGDSILNSLTDIIACAFGYLLAMWLPVWFSVVLFVGLESALLLWIRDSLVLNIIMLIYPIEAIREWQQR